MSSNTIPNREIQITSFDSAPDYASNYLRTFFMGDPVPDVQALMGFLAGEYKKIEGVPTILEIGCGPIINQIVSAVPFVSSIHMADYRQDNLDQIRKWMDKDPQAHSWGRYTRYALMCEGIIPTERSIRDREEETRRKIQQLSLCDLRKEYPFGIPLQYQAVSCFYTTEQASTNLEEWRSVYRNLAALVAPGGRLFNCAVGHTDHYVLYDSSGATHYYPVPRLSEKDFEQALRENDFDMSKSVVRYQSLSGQESEGVYGVILVSAVKSI